MKRKCLIISKIGWPFGGGEDFLLDSMNFYDDIETYWISFCSIKQENHHDFKLKDRMIYLQGGFNKATIVHWIKLIKPDFIHTQGHNVVDVLKIGMEYRIPVIIGFHFWLSLIDLHPKTFNSQILQNIEKHTKSALFDFLTENSFPYVCSPFMNDVIRVVTDKEIPVVIPASSVVKKCDAPYKERGAKFVTQVNIHKLKGGEIFLRLLEACPDIPFMCVQTESFSEDLDLRIKGIMDQRENCVYMTHTQDIKSVYADTKVLLIPSIVDETFCRVCNEGILNDIPILSTGDGNIKYMLEHDDNFILDSNAPSEEWALKLRRLYDNAEEMSDRISGYYATNSTAVGKSQLRTVIDRVLNRKKKIMFLAPYCDQGLGIQVRNYARILRNEFDVFIYSFQPYCGAISKLQRDRSEWKEDGYVVEYSKNNREELTDDELTRFITKNGITHCFLPETCWPRVFEIAKLIDRLNVKCYAIPNIEIVRRDEVYKHRFFYKILCNNRICLDFFQKYGFSNASLIGYGEPSKFRDKSQSRLTKFLCVGGLNAYTRKRVDRVCQSFVIAHKVNPDLRLTVTVQGNHSDVINEFHKHSFITVITRHLSYQEILNLYYETNVTIQVSSHEGLGLGFYESLSTGTPVLTLDTAPHNEIIREGVNGWIIPCFKKKMLDNPESLVQESHFEPHVLADKILAISPVDPVIYATLRADFELNYSAENLKNKIIHITNEL
jgi:glycosyltransferase involved in cell wall biosynthesis